MALIRFDSYNDLGGAGVNPVDDTISRRTYSTDVHDIYMQNGAYSGEYSAQLRDTNGGLDFRAGLDTGNYNTEDTKIWGITFYVPRTVDWDSYYLLRWITDAGQWGCGLRCYNNGAFALYTNLQSIIAVSRQGVVKPECWYQLECKIKYHDTDGTFEMRLDGEEMFNETGIDTAGTSGNSHARVRWHSFQAVASYVPLIGAAWVCDTTGNTCNDFLGGTRIHTRLPESDNVAEWTPSTGNTNYEVVDERAIDDDTTYISEDTTGNVASFGSSNLPSTANHVYGVKLGLDARSEQGDTETCEQVIESGGTEYTGNSHALGTDWAYRQYLTEEDPDTGTTWTVNGYNSTKFGVEKTS